MLYMIVTYNLIIYYCIMHSLTWQRPFRQGHRSQVHIFVSHTLQVHTHTHTSVNYSKRPIFRQVNFRPTKIYKDSEGRFIIVNGSINGIQVSFMNIHALNKDEPGFINMAFSTILLAQLWYFAIKRGVQLCCVSAYGPTTSLKNSHDQNKNTKNTCWKTLVWWIFGEVNCPKIENIIYFF